MWDIFAFISPTVTQTPFAAQDGLHEMLADSIFQVDEKIAATASHPLPGGGPASRFVSWARPTPLKF
jgi:hypothetical protein